MTSLNNPVKLPLDANGNVLANINAQNITPNAKATNVSVDANGNVLSNVNAQNINPNVNTVNNPTIANPYTPTLLSHQTGLSGTPSSANAPVNVGSSITAPRAGVLKIKIFGHVTAGAGFIDIALTSGGITSYLPLNSSTTVSNTLVADAIASSTTTLFQNTAEQYLYPTVGTTNYGDILLTIELTVNANDVIQFRVSNNTANDTTYIDDLEVLLI